ncbi:MAG TPA: thermonuclease family protein [Bauldia sp.]|nr:thermonuclease family protein [Bauldia sp.]
MSRRPSRPCRLALAAALFSTSPLAAGAEVIAGPVPAEVIRVVDGDTLALRARVWIGLEVTVNARIRGIDAPERNGKCAREKALAETARLRLAAAAGDGKVRLTRIENDKYAGRVIADIVTDAGTDLAEAMLASGLVRAYDGGTRDPWCGVASLDG